MLDGETYVSSASTTASSLTRTDIDAMLTKAADFVRRRKEDDRTVFLFDGAPELLHAEMRRACGEEMVSFEMMSFGPGPLDGLVVEWDSGLRRTVVGTWEALRRLRRLKPKWPPDPIEMG